MSLSALRSRGFLSFLQIVISAGLLGWLFSRPDFRHDLHAAFSVPHPLWLVAAFVAAGLANALCLLRWSIFLGMSGLAVPWREKLGVFFAGLFGNLFLPGGAGGDLVKVGLLAGRRHDPGRAALSVVMDRMCGSVSMLILGLVLILPRKSLPENVPALEGVSHGILVYLLLLFLLITSSVILSGDRVRTRLPLGFPARAKLIELAQVYHQCAVHWRLTPGAAGISCVMLLIYFATFYFAALAWGLDVPLLAFLSWMPVVDIISGLPVSLGGLGVRETVFVFVLSQWGISAGTAVAISLTGYAVSSLWALPGGILWMWRKRS